MVSTLHGCLYDNSTIAPVNKLKPIWRFSLFLPSFTFLSFTFLFKVVKITDLGKDKNQHKMLKIQQIFLKLYRCLLYVVFHNLEPKNAGLVDVERDLN